MNRVDVWGLESESNKEESTGNENEDPAKEAGKHIVGSGIKSALWNAAKGYAADGLAGAAARGVLASVFFAYWASPAYALMAVGELGVSIFYFLRRDTHYVCRQCMRRYGADEVKQTSLDDGT